MSGSSSYSHPERKSCFSFMWLLLYPQHSFMSMNQLTHNSWPQLMVGDRIGHLDDTKVRMRKMVREAREFVSHKNRDMSGLGCVVMFRLCCCIEKSQLRRKERERREGEEREKGRREKRARENRRRGDRRTRERQQQTMKPAIYRYPPLPPFPPSFLHAKIAKGRKEGRNKSNKVPKSLHSKLHLLIRSSFAPVSLKQQLLTIFTLELMTHQIPTFL